MNRNHIGRSFLAALTLALAVHAVAAEQGKTTSPATAPNAVPAAGTYTVDPVHTFMTFVAQHKVVGRVLGRFDKTTGTIVAAQDPAASSLEISIEAASVSTQNSVRDEDLRGPDFFDAARFPVIRYEGRGARRAGDGWVVDGKLTIRGTTRAVPLSFTYRGTAPAKPGQPARFGFHATAAAKRADFGMTRELLDEIGAVSDSPDVWIQIEAELVGPPASPPAR